MYFCFAEKVGNRFLQEWDMRTIAFDCTRRYLYYSDSLPMLSKAERNQVQTLDPKADGCDNGPATPLSSPMNDAERLSSGSTSGEPQRSGSSSAFEERAFTFSSRDPISRVNMRLKASEVKWKRKLKVLNVEAVMTRIEFSIDDPHLQERDLYQLRIRAEERTMVEGETPPMGPLLCPSAALTPLPLRLTLGNRELIDDPLLLKDIFNGLRDHYHEINMERERIIRTAVETGETPPVFPHQTIDSPVKAGSIPYFAKKTILLRCRDEREFRRLWYVLQTVLGHDKLIIRPYRGLPPYDPRNSISFAHVPIYVWKPFFELDKAVFYIFARGSLFHCQPLTPATDAGGHHVSTPTTPLLPASSPALTVTSAGATGRTEDRVAAPRLEVGLKCAYLSITHDMVLIMRSTGNIPRWVRLREINAFHYNTQSNPPFVVFLADEGIPDILFAPKPPLFGPDAVRNYDPRFEVARIAKVIHDSCFASQTIRRVIEIKEVQDRTIAAYARRMSEEGRELSSVASEAYTRTSTVSCPLPKEQLAAVWQQVQTDILQRSAASREGPPMAIPLYTSTATHINLTPAELEALSRRLEEGRMDTNDIVGVPLSAMRHSNPNSLAGPNEPSPSSPTPAAAGEHTLVLPPAAPLLHTPQLLGGRVLRRNSSEDGHGRDDGEDSDYCDGSPVSYLRGLGPGASQEVEALTSSPATLFSVREVSEEEVRRAPTAAASPTPSDQSSSYTEWQVGELVQRSVKAMAS